MPKLNVTVGRIDWWETKNPVVLYASPPLDLMLVLGSDRSLPNY